jgi:hypothetical protein
MDIVKEKSLFFILQGIEIRLRLSAHSLVSIAMHYSDFFMSLPRRMVMGEERKYSTERAAIGPQPCVYLTPEK